MKVMIFFLLLLLSHLPSQGDPCLHPGSEMPRAPPKKSYTFLSHHSALPLPSNYTLLAVLVMCVCVWIHAYAQVKKERERGGEGRSSFRPSSPSPP